MSYQIQIDIPQGANVELLRDELRSAVGEYVAGISTTSDGVFVIIEDNASIDIEDQFAGIIAAHNPAQLTARQAAFATAKTAPERAKAVPGWATWDEEQAIAYIDKNVTDLASAKTVLVAMAQLLVAQRDALWPGLGVE